MSDHDPDEQLAETLDRELRRAAKDWPLTRDKLDTAATWAIAWLCDGLDDELVDEFHNRLEDGRLRLGCVHDWTDDEVLLTIDGDPFCAVKRELVVATPQG
jgi:hypothetical protein